MADCEPVDARLYSISPAGVKLNTVLHALKGLSVRRPTATRGLRIMVGPTWHLRWGDVYEWRHARFEFANQRSPDFYGANTWLRPQTDGADTEFFDWMIEASRLDILHKFKAGARDWTAALRALRRQENSETEGDETERFGDPETLLTEIRQRLTWIRRRQYNHALLYRPIDYDLKVPPYELGNSQRKQRH